MSVVRIYPPPFIALLRRRMRVSPAPPTSWDSAPHSRTSSALVRLLVRLLRMHRLSGRLGQATAKALPGRYPCPAPCQVLGRFPKRSVRALRAVCDACRASEAPAPPPVALSAASASFRAEAFAISCALTGWQTFEPLILVCTSWALVTTSSTSTPKCPPGTAPVRSSLLRWRSVPCRTKATESVASPLGTLPALTASQPRAITASPADTGGLA